MLISSLQYRSESPEHAARLLRRGSCAPLLMAGQDHQIPLLPDAYSSANPLEPAIAAVRCALSAPGKKVEATGVERQSYLELIDGVVGYFRHFQDPTGRIIDPFFHKEYQYSTPTYAMAAGLLVSSGRRPELLASASSALESSLYQLASGTATDRHGDFFIAPTMMAWRYLSDRTDAQTRVRWNRYLEMISPDRAYSDLIGAEQQNVINWNTSAIAGEFLRHKEGYTDLGFVEKYIHAQRPHLTAEGLYLEPGAPLTYDAAARFNFSLILAEGYTGDHAAALDALMERGAWTSLLTQSPRGDAPTGGRSAEHVWNDALACAMFELWATRSKTKGDDVAMRAFKRAAHLAAQSVARWVRPSGEFWIVKNHFDPAVRHGFEDYSSHSQYNLLAASYLAFAWSYADESIGESEAPAETGGFVLELPFFKKVFANSGGHHLEIDTSPDPGYNSTGLLRVHRRDLDEVLGPGGNAPACDVPLAVGVQWLTRGEWQSLAQCSSSQVTAHLTRNDAGRDEVSFEVHYQLSGALIEGLTEQYLLRPGHLEVRVRFDGPIDRWRVRFPAFVFDGKRTGQVDVEANTATVSLDRCRQRFSVTQPAGTTLHRTGRLVPTRNAYYDVIEGEGHGCSVAYRLGE